MKSAQGLTGICISGIIGSAAVLAITQPATAIAKITDVQLTPTASGLNIVLQTQSGDRPQVFSVNRGNSWTADLVNTQLQLPNGKFQKANPAEGIASVDVTALDKNSVRITVTGQNGTPTGQVVRSQNGNLVFSLARPATKAARSTPAKSIAAKPAPVPAAKSAPAAKAVRSVKSASSPSSTNSPRQSSPAALPALPNTIAQIPALPPAPTQATPPVNGRTPALNAQAAPSASPLPPFQGAAPLVPNPSLTVDGTPYRQPPPVPPFAPVPLPKAVAPPVGDIAVSQTDATPTVIDLGTAERVPRLVLRDASSREVLSLLARSAGLNVVFTDQAQGQQQQQQQQQQGTTAGEGPRVTLDIVNEPIQNVFNYVLQVTGLDASRRGNTIFVGTRLPNSARNLVVRSLRLNQVQVSVALPFLVSLGAESAVSRERLVTAVNAIPITNITQAGQGQVGQTQAITQSQTTTEQRLEVQRVEYTDSTPILRGLQVSGDERTNTVTIVGDARKVDIAISQLAQLDVRRRQVAVNVRVIDIDLLAFERLGSSFSFGVDNTQIVNSGGVGVINFGSQLPAISGVANSPQNIGVPTTIFGSSPSAPGFSTQFFLQLQAAISNQSAKILTDPTLVVQEGQQAQVELGEEVVTNIRQQTTATENSTQITVSVEKAVAGLTLPINIDRIDDNGFISLSLAPLISRPQGTQVIAFTTGGQTVSNPITLLALRRVQSGQVRLRDGQTLLLSGIIQDQDRTTVTKVPILGDIPILGALFRRTDNENRRREVIVLLTPRILDDTDRSAFGYSYTPGVETRRLLQQQQR